MENTRKDVQGISRARFLAGAAAVGLAGAVLPSTSAAATGGRHGGLRHRGVVYTLGAGETPGTAWSAARMRRDIRVIRDELHADTVDVTGDDVERLTTTAAEAAERG
ncbi:MAG: abortive phage infection protein, partial [Streptomycetaceae bacterium]|nr:abortive phage infection protein [Streptomycetaceae bacterium]